MKNHVRVNGKLLQTNKRYSSLKQRQKEKIGGWMYDAYKSYVLEHGRKPSAKDADAVLDPVMEKISEADIWIPYGEVRAHFQSSMTKYEKRLERESVRKVPQELLLRPLDTVFAVCKVADYSEIDIDQPFAFIGRTDEEKSLVCPLSIVPDNTIKRDDGWKAFRIEGELDFSLVGILAEITRVLAAKQIGIFAISTFNTDYVMTRESNFNKAIDALLAAGYQIMSDYTATE